MDLSELAAYAEEKFNIREQFKWADFPGFSILAAPYSGKWAALLMRLKDPETHKELQRCDIKCGLSKLEELKLPYLSQPFRMKGLNWLGVTFDERTEPEVVFRLFDQAVYTGEQSGYTLVLEEQTKTNSTETYSDTALPGPTRPVSRTNRDPDVPEKIREMMRIYKYGNNSFSQKCKNFFLQGKFMEDYEDDAPWSGDFRHYFPTYHDLNANQLRGYFTWRTNVRKGIFQKLPSSMAYIYIYELLNGIGTSSPEDTLQKLEAFESGFLDSGIGEPGIREKVHRWMLEFAIIKGILPEQARKYADPDLLQKDEALLILKDPQDHTDEAVFSSLCVFAGEKFRLSPVLTKNKEKGEHLFAEVWRYTSQFFTWKNQNLFDTCFGKQNSYHWYPLANAIYYWKDPVTEHTEYDLDACRKYICHYGVWVEKKYENLYFEKKRFQALFHEADRLLRSYLKTGHPLKEKPEENWAAPYVQAIIEIDKKAELEAARTKITIDLSGLDRIRRDAIQTRDSLLTEEEMAEFQNETPEKPQEPSPVHIEPNEEEPEERSKPGVSIPLDPQQISILQALLDSGSAEQIIRENHLLPSVVTDAINEALFDEIGDSVLDCDGSNIIIIEDYRDDIISLLGGKNE
ncbi:MAG: TerB N-terminal domain-containing protein [Anaerolineaceae bacterium]|nr:TerB N-terminal domain-containing protein [Anaerolineaceae bacterium]